MQSTARIEELRVVGDHRLRLTFAPRLSAELEFTADVLKGAPAALADPAYFARVKTDAFGQLVWPNGYTLSYDAIYERAAKGGGKGARAGEPAGSGKNGGGTVPALLGTILSGLGVLGFVTFAGGVILWSRFNEMGVPADHALGLVPKSELVSTGADFLVPAFLIAAGVVLLVVLLSVTVEFFEDWKPLRWAVTPTVIGVAELIVLGHLTRDFPIGSVVLLIFVIAIGSLAISSGARLNLAVFAVAIFGAVGSFAIARTYELTTHDLKVLPMAYSRTQPGEATRVEVGYFVAETSDRILFASLPTASTGATTAAPNELRAFPRDETDDLEIGELARPREAESIAARFAYNLCERLAHLTPAAPSAGSAAAPGGKAAVAPAAKASPICPRPYLKQLAAKAGIEWTPDRAEKLEEGLLTCHRHTDRHARALCEQRVRKLDGSNPPRRGTGKRTK